MRQQSFMVLAAMAVLAILTAALAAGQSRQQFQAQAFGQGTQAGRTFGVKIIINEYSTPADQKILIDAFASKGMEGLSNAIRKMPAKGRIAITGTVGYDVNYIRLFQTPTGRKIRLVTDRPITFGEAWTDSRSRDYTLSAVELNVGSDGKGTGALLPACQFKINKENELEIEAYRNPWRLAEVFEWK
jgi:hypothetical protein